MGGGFAQSGLSKQTNKNLRCGCTKAARLISLVSIALHKKRHVNRGGEGASHVM